MKSIECVIFDWAGTAVDYGCFAPVAAFTEAFKGIGLEISSDEARGPMGMNKIDHIRELFKLDNVTAQFKNLFSRDWTEEDVVEMNRSFESFLFASLSNYTTPINNVLDVVAELRAKGLKIGSTSGYTAKMMEVVSAGAEAKGYKPDCYVTADGLPAGRPQPFMIYQNMINLAVSSPKSIVKVGDTVSDIKEGVNAGVYSVGVILGSSEMALSEEEVAALAPEVLNEKIEVVRQRFMNAGAYTTILTMAELPALINKIENE